MRVLGINLGASDAMWAMRRNRGFTLTELLVALAIMGATIILSHESLWCSLGWI